MLAQIDLAHHLIGGQLLGAAGLEDFALEEQVGAVGDGERLIDVVVGDDDSDIFVLERGHDALNILDGDRIDARERLVEQDECRVDGHRAGDFRAPTLAARELDAQALAYFLQAELLDQRFAALRLIGLAEVGHLEHGPDVVLHAQATEYRRLLGQVAHAHLRTAVNGFIRKFRDAALIVLEENLPLVGLDEPDDHVERGRFPRSVGPEQADDFSLIHIDRDVVHHRSGLVFLDQFACVEAHFFRGILYKVS